MEKCIVCGKELTTPRVEKCLDCFREEVRHIFKEQPEVKEAFHESIEEMKKPENMNKMVDDICQFMSAVQNLQKTRK